MAFGGNACAGDCRGGAGGCEGSAGGAGEAAGVAHGTHTLLTYTIGGQESAAASAAPKKAAEAKVKTPTIAKVAP
ncbi:hypothetical protein JAO32_19910, partial [Terriglobus sp. ADX1]